MTPPSSVVRSAFASRAPSSPCAHFATTQCRLRAGASLPHGTLPAPPFASPPEALFSPRACSRPSRFCLGLASLADSPPFAALAPASDFDFPQSEAMQCVLSTLGLGASSLSPSGLRAPPLSCLGWSALGLGLAVGAVRRFRLRSRRRRPRARRSVAVNVLYMSARWRAFGPPVRLPLCCLILAWVRGFAVVL